MGTTKLTAEEFLEDFYTWSEEKVALVRVMIEGSGHGWEDIFDPHGDGFGSGLIDFKSEDYGDGTLMKVDDLQYMAQESDIYLETLKLVRFGLSAENAVEYVLAPLR